jgi:alpha-tubulin suppressor-like RCC1 family protein
MNAEGQLGIGGDQEYLGKSLFFFPNFMKKDFFNEQGLKVLDVSFGTGHTLVHCMDKTTKKFRVFGCGSSFKGQLCNVTSIPSHQFIELSKHFPDEVSQISAGSLHSLFVTKTD